MDEPARAPQHDAPPPWRPLSAGAVTALVLSLLLAPAFFGPWWLEILPLVVGAASWWAIADGRRRGRGVAIVACVIALSVGTTSVVVLGATRRGFEAMGDRLLRALAKGDRRELTGWVVEGEDKAAAVARWQERLQAAEREAGPYGQRVDVDWGLLGPIAGLLLRPDGPLDEVGAPPDRALPPGGETLWFQAGFARERLWTAVELGHGDGGVDFESLRTSSAHERLPVREVRFFRRRAAP